MYGRRLGGDLGGEADQLSVDGPIEAELRDDRPASASARDVNDRGCQRVAELLTATRAQDVRGRESAVGQDLEQTVGGEQALEPERVEAGFRRDPLPVD